MRLSHYCHVPAGQPVSLHRLITAAGLRWPVEESFEFGKDCFALDQSQVRLHTAITRHTVLVMAALAVCVIAAARARQRTDIQAQPPAGPDDLPPADPGLIQLTVAEMKRLYCAATTRPRPLWHAARWSRWRRRHQARARWYHKRARLARQHKLAYGVPPGRDSRREALPRFLWLPSAAGEGGRRRRAITLANTGCDDRAAVLSRFVRVTAGVRVAVGQLAASRLGQGISYISSSD